VPLPLLPVVGAAVAAGVLLAVELWLDAVDDVELELVAVLFSAVVEDVDDALPAYEAAAA
jgi:hypothetical protein